MDQFVMKLRIVRFIRTPDYNNLFSGDPTWVTESIGGMGEDGRTLVTQQLLPHAPDPLQSGTGSGTEPDGPVVRGYAGSLQKLLRQGLHRNVLRQYENDDLMRPHWGDDYGIACCVSAMRIGKQMQFFGARANLAKCLLHPERRRGRTQGQAGGPAPPRATRRKSSSTMRSWPCTTTCRTGLPKPTSTP